MVDFYVSSPHVSCKAKFSVSYHVQHQYVTVSRFCATSILSQLPTLTQPPANPQTTSKTHLINFLKYCRFLCFRPPWIIQSNIFCISSCTTSICNCFLLFCKIDFHTTLSQPSLNPQPTLKKSLNPQSTLTQPSDNLQKSFDQLYQIW